MAGNDIPQSYLHVSIVLKIHDVEAAACKFFIVSQRIAAVKMNPQDFPVFLFVGAVEMVLLAVDIETLSFCEGVGLSLIFQMTFPGYRIYDEKGVQVLPLGKIRVAGLEISRLLSIEKKVLRRCAGCEDEPHGVFAPGVDSPF